MAETGASAVKMEGGEHMEETIRFIVDRSIPVIAHIDFGLRQSRRFLCGAGAIDGRCT